MTDTNGNAGAKSGAGPGTAQAVAPKSRGLVFKEAAEKALGPHKEIVGAAVSVAMVRGIVEPLAETISGMEGHTENALSLVESKANVAKEAAEAAGKTAGAAQKTMDGLRTDVRSMVEQAEQRIGVALGEVSENVKKEGDARTQLLEQIADLKSAVEQMKVEMREQLQRVDEDTRKTLEETFTSLDADLGEFKTALETASDEKIKALQDNFTELKVAVERMSEELNAMNRVEIPLKEGDEPQKMTLPTAIHLVLMQVQTIRTALDGYGRDLGDVEKRVGALEDGTVDKTAFDLAVKGLHESIADLSRKVDGALRQFDEAVANFDGFISQLGAFISGATQGKVHMEFGETTDELPPDGSKPDGKGPTPGSAAAA